MREFTATEDALMHAALVSVRVEPEALETARAMLEEQIAPMIARAPGFIAGYWLEPEDDVGLAVLLYETVEQARAGAPSVGPAPAPGATVEDVRFRRVMVSR